MCGSRYKNDDLEVKDKRRREKWGNRQFT